MHQKFFLSFTQRVALSIVVVLVLAGTIAGYSIVTLRQIDEANFARNRMTDARKTARSLDIDTLRIIIDLQYYIAERDEKYLTDIAENRENSKLQRERLRTLTTQERTIELLDKYEKLLPDRIAAANAIIAGVNDSIPASDMALLTDARKKLDDESRQYLRDIIAIEELSSTEALKTLSERIAQAQTTLIVLVVVLGVGFAIVALFMYRSVIRPVKGLTDMAYKIQKGDLMASNNITTNDEIGTLARSLNTMTRELKRVDDIKSNFISIASHQLRTPATAVKQNLGLIIEGIATKDSDKARFIQAAYESNEYQLAIIEDILNIARIEAGTVKLDKNEVELGALIQKVVDEQKASAKSGQKIAYSVPVKKVTVNADATKLKMCIGNLLSNAIKYTPEGGRITLDVHKLDSGVEVRVRDTGVGISQEDQAKLFSKFSRVDNPLSAKVGGTGLGLYLVRELIRMHEGEVSVTSSAGKGSTFIIKLPKE